MFSNFLLDQRGHGGAGSNAAAVPAQVTTKLCDPLQVRVCHPAFTISLK